MASKVKGSTKGLDKLLKNIDSLPEKIQEFAERRLYSLSPVDTGDFRAAWNVDLQNDGILIYNTDTPAIKQRMLEDGYSSQAPNGVLNIVVAEVKYEISAHMRKIR